MSAASKPLHEVEIVSPFALEQFKHEWKALWADIPDANPFQAPAWILAWAGIYAPGRCWAASLRIDGKLAAVVPVFCWEGAVLLAGTGPSDLASALFRPGSEYCAPELLAALAGAIAEPFNRMDLRQLASASPLCQAAVPEGWGGEIEEGEPCPLLAVSGPDGMAAVPPRMRSNWRNAVRRFAREGGMVEQVGAQGTGTAITSLERLHAARWRKKGQHGVLVDPSLSAFLRNAVPELDRAGLLRIQQLNFGADIVGVLFAMRGKTATHYYLSGFDPAFAHFSPGTILVGAAIQAAAGEGLSAFDFLRGCESYKYAWGAEDRPTARRMLVRIG
ncbi:MAG: hypothetical protein JWM91_3353 [Rhodospirillales bacterium]|nr:hypothetical protein [Rhodospirillales bacterium]